MAKENIDQRRNAVSEMIKQQHSTKDIAKIATEYDCTYSTVLADITFLNRKNTDTVYPSPSTKNKVLKRDNFECQYCGQLNSSIVDHVIPSYNGGVGYSYNLVACCSSCNYKKKKKTVIPNNFQLLKNENKEWADRIIEMASFSIPNIINLTVLAKELGISKQLLDYRIRNGFTEVQKKEIENIFKKHLTNVK